MKALVLLSGGIDSSTCLSMAVDKHGEKEVLALTVFYGQRHEKEIEAARNVANYYKVKHKEINLEELFEGSKCSLLKKVDKKIPHQTYEEQTKSAKGKPVSTYVPFRNGLFLSVAASMAIVNNCDEIYYGAHKDDATGNAYPDCSEDFNKSMSNAIYLGSGEQVKIIAPFINKNKSEVIKKGIELKTPYELTWSCYEGNEKPCGKCGTCIDRQKAFEANGIKDPII